MKLVIIESPYAGDVTRHTAYARACLLDSLRRGEAPFASHLLYTQVLDDQTPGERAWGLEAGWAWGVAADLVAVYTDLGTSTGMDFGILKALAQGKPIEFRLLGGEWSS